MVLTPIDVQQKTFATAMRGYDLDEVDDFLDKVVISLKDYEQRLRDAQERIATLESELSQRSDQESAISRALVAAQRSADALVEDAREEANRIVAAAESHASDLQGQRDEERRALTEEIESIRAQVAELRSGVAAMLTSVAADLDEVEEFVDSEGTVSSDTESEAATFDAAEPLVDDVPDEDVPEEDAPEAVANESVSAKIVIDGTDDIDADDAWDLDDDSVDDGGFESSASIDEITGRIDEVFGDLDDDEDVPADGSSDDEYEIGDLFEDDDDHEDDAPIRPWES